MGIYWRARRRRRAGSAFDGRIVLARFPLAIDSFTELQEDHHRLLGMETVPWSRRGVQPRPWQLVANVHCMGADDRRTSLKTRSLGACIIAHATTNLLLAAYVVTSRQWFFLVA